MAQTHLTNLLIVVAFALKAPFAPQASVEVTA
jgi:hypothetical protein